MKKEEKVCAYCQKVFLTDKINKKYCSSYCARKARCKVKKRPVARTLKKLMLSHSFTEIGETVEETVAREVMEETGVKVKNIKYYKSQPWGFDSDLLLGFFCDLDGDDTIHMDDGELSVAEWIDYKDMPRYHEGLSLTEEMMNHFIEERINFHKKDK